jgi:CheY-like chemotaxis protein
MDDDVDTVLLVEDNADDVSLFERAFGRTGFPHRLETVQSGDEAIGYLNGSGVYADREEYPLPALLLLDIKLPGKDGFQVLDWIRHDPKFAPLRVIMLTSSPRSVDVNRAYRMGANSYLSKPVDTSGLVDILKALGAHWLQHSKIPDLETRVGVFTPALAASASASGVLSPESSLGSSAAVLLIDDNEDDTLLLRHAMESCCPSVTNVQSVSDMESGKSYLQGTGKYADRDGFPMPRLIMLDVNLRRGSGGGFLEWAKAHPQFNTIPIVAITGDISARQATKLLARGVNAVMVKGADFSKLRQGLLHVTELWLRHSVVPELYVEAEKKS